MRVKLCLLSCIVIVLMGVGVFPALAQDDFTPTFESGECQFDVTAGLDIECGFVTVPENRIDPTDTDTIRLAVAVVRTQSINPQPDPIIYLDGGPGGQTIASLPGLYENQFLPLADADRDIIFFDQRGVGFSEPNLFCQDSVDLELDLLQRNITDVEENELFFNATFACRAQYIAQGIDLSAYTTRQNAADVNDIRQALSYDQLNLLGISYGSLLGQVIMRDFPDMVRSVILDGVVDPASIQFSVAGQVNQIQNAFDTVFAACNADPACASAYPNLEALTYSLANSWNEEPINVDIMLQDGSSYNAVIDGADALSTVVLLFYITDAVPIIPLYIYEMALGDYRRLALIRGAQVDQLGDFYEGMLYSIICQEDGPLITEQLIDETLSDISQVVGEYVESIDVSPYEVIRLCSDWTEGFINDEVIEPVVSDLPTLLLSGEYDPVTPVEFANTVAETLSNHYSYEMPGGGHGVSLDGGCPMEIAIDFINNPNEEPDASCIDEMGFEFAIVDIPGVQEFADQIPPLDDVDSTLPEQATLDEPLSADNITLVPFTDEALGVSGVAPEGWERVDDIVYGIVADSVQYQLAYRIPADGLLGYYQRIILTDGFYGYDAMPEPNAFYEVNGVVWKIYEIENESQAVYSLFAIAEIDGQGYIIGMVAGTDEQRQALYDVLLIPAIDNFAIVD
ncbi:MAG: alpha/beta fold hydrolase [Aggregatilineales bacterium]